MIQTKNFSKLIQTFFFVILILYWGRQLFIPLSFSLLISCLLYPGCVWFEKRGFSRSAAIATSMSLLGILISSVGFILFIQLQNFSMEWDGLKIKIIETYYDIEKYVSAHLNVSVDDQQSWFKSTIKESGSRIISFIGSSLYSIGSYFILAVIIPILSSLLLYNRTSFVHVIFMFFPMNQQENIRKILQEVIQTYYNFIKGMLLVYLIVGILNSIGLGILGIPHPILFGFIASILTFIPYVGIIIASLLPITVSWVTYGSIWYPVGVIVIFSIVQYLEANLIFPFVVSNRLKINTAATIIAILAGGIIWGSAGMILFIPFVAILKLISDKNENLKILSLLLGNGDRINNNV